MEMVKVEREVREWYENYVKSFHKNDVSYMENINLKYDHTERVVIEARGIAVSLGLPPNDIALVLMTALLHDIGRYPQMRDYGTFNDRASVNHAELGVKVVKEANVLKRLSLDEQDLILLAIGNHNKYEIDSSLTEKQQLFVKILRDADKLDILRILSIHYHQTESEKNRHIQLNLDEQGTVRKEIIDNLIKNEPVKYVDLKNVNELKLLHLSWVYDINYHWTFQLINNRGFIDQIIEALPSDKEIEKIVQNVKAHLEAKVRDAKKMGLRGR